MNTSLFRGYSGPSRWIGPDEMACRCGDEMPSNADDAKVMSHICRKHAKLQTAYSHQSAPAMPSFGRAGPEIGNCRMVTGLVRPGTGVALKGSCDGGSFGRPQAQSCLCKRPVRPACLGPVLERTLSRFPWLSWLPLAAQLPRGKSSSSGRAPPVGVGSGMRNCTMVLSLRSSRATLVASRM